MQIHQTSQHTEIQQLTDITVDARTNLINEVGDIALIDGACHENAIHLAEYIQEYTSYTSYIRWGAVNFNKKEYATLKEAEHDGGVHFWVEVDSNHKDTRAILDLFSMRSPQDDINRGDVYSGYTYPKSYQPLEDTLFEYNPNVIDPSNLLSYTDYEHLKLVLGLNPVD